MRDFCVLVSSSDQGQDIFEVCFQNAERVWQNCDWPRYVGFTTQQPSLYGFKSLAAKRPSNWQTELADQLDQLPSEIRYVLLLIEDAFIESPVPDLTLLASVIGMHDFAYVSLVPLRRNLFGKIIEYVRWSFSSQPFRKYAPSEPYYSSFGVVIWRRSYLRRLLTAPGSIWDLEHIVSNEPHYAVWRTVLRPDHLVIKGRWAPRARRKLMRHGIYFPQGREVRPFGEWLRDIRETISFHTFGFLSFRIRRRFNKISHRAP